MLPSRQLCRKTSQGPPKLLLTLASPRVLLLALALLLAEAADLLQVRVAVCVHQPTPQWLTCLSIPLL
jgi:hypothetical protein